MIPSMETLPSMEAMKGCMDLGRVAVDDERVEIVFGWWEVPFVGRRRLEVGHEEVAKAAVIAHPMRRNLGPRAGFWITGLVKVGLFGTARRCVTSVRRGRPALHLILREGGERVFHEVLVGDARAREHAQALGVTQ